MSSSASGRGPHAVSARNCAASACSSPCTVRAPSVSTVPTSIVSSSSGVGITVVPSAHACTSERETKLYWAFVRTARRACSMAAAPWFSMVTRTANPEESVTTGVISSICSATGEALGCVTPSVGSCAHAGAAPSGANNVSSTASSTAMVHPTPP